METNHCSRRDLFYLLAAAPFAATIAPGPSRGAESTHPMPAELKMGCEKIALLVYPEFTALDALGPHYALSGMMGASVTFVAKTLEPVPCEGSKQAGLFIKPHYAFADCPRDLDLLLVPGGVTGTLAAIADEATRAFVAEVGGRAKLAGSVCTGSLLLGAAGLLKGRQATSHWQLLPVLKEVGATPVARRIVFDGPDRVTAAGVSAGLDLGFELVRRYRGDFYAKGMQLLGEYDPQPPFPTCGNPKTADKEVVTMLDAMHAPLVEQFRAAVGSVRTSS